MILVGLSSLNFSSIILFNSSIDNSEIKNIFNSRYKLLYNFLNSHIDDFKKLYRVNFNEELFRVESPKGHKFVLKPVQGPHHTQIFASKLRSYKDLPIRYMESDKQYRAELQGAVSGLSRVYAITVEDGHSFCTREQVKQEVMNMCNLIKFI